ncbi:hypothetical protein GCM10017612_21240 [Novosphingobium resinovorum]|nr:hypothetical protein GCM10017612_21240 [Novosphingobium resinovorum]
MLGSPLSLSLAVAETTGEPRIEARWFETALKKVRDEAKLLGDSRGDETLPIFVTTRILVNGKVHEDVALYDLGYSIAGRLLDGQTITLRGISLVARTRGTAGRRLLDARWTAALAMAGN